MRRLFLAALVLMLCVSLDAQKKKTAPPPTVAPDVVSHDVAQLLRTMSKDGNRQVTFRATAVGTRFFFQEPNGVTVYRFDKGRYIKEELLRGSTLAKAVKRYSR